MKKLLKCIANWFVFVFTHRGPITNEAVDNEIVDHSGQGRDKYGN